MTSPLDQFIKDQHLPKTFRALVDEYYVPLAQWLYQQGCVANRAPQAPLLVGINGAQGTGKSTLSAVLKIILEATHGWRVAILSLDDLYLRQAERDTLAQTVHPLLKTRGVPGTHDTAMGIDIIEQAKALKPGQNMYLPRFDKALDDRKPSTAWDTFTGPADLIIFEGWCVGSVPMNSGELTAPINDLETQEDQNGTWRRYINHQLHTDYRELFAELDLLVMLKAPDFDSVYRWRLEQEQKLTTVGMAKNQLMDEQSLLRFIQHYQRLSLHNLKEIPSRADVVLTLNHQHNITHADYKNHGSHHE